MKMRFDLEMSQKQELVMTTELRQAIEILQYNSFELNQYVDEQLLENPTLEKEEVEQDNLEDIDWDEVADDDYHNRYSSFGYSSYNDDYNYENFISEDLSLIEYLETQLIFSNLDEKYYDVARYMIDSVDINGYLDYDLDKILKKFDWIDPEMIEEIVYYLQDFEPAGICARNLQECLLIQLQRQAKDNNLEIEIVKDYLEELSNNKLKKIAQGLDKPIKEIQTACDYVKTLEPRPGEMYNNTDTKYVDADVILKKTDGNYQIEIPNYTAPRLYLSSFYKKIVKESATKDNAKKYIEEQMQKAVFLIKSIEQRRDTIYRVVEEILKQQREFFDKGILYLKSLNMSKVADALDIHESTVSRTANGKYLQTPTGLYEIKYFFQSGIKTNGRNVSAATIKYLIKDIIKNENKKKPFSDQKITDNLKEYGISCSRRTIAKYRKSLGIGSSRKRKRF